MKRILFVLLFICSAQIVLAHQRIDIRPLDTSRYGDRYRVTNSIDVLGSYNIGTYSYLELGIAKSWFGESCFPLSTAYTFSSEFRLGGDRFIMGPKVGFWFGSMIAMGVNAVYYTDFKQGSLRFRPELGFGLRYFKIVAGYNCAITNRHFSGINTPVATFAAYVPVKRTVKK